MMILKKILHEEVRAVIGASETDLSDEAITALRLEDELRVDLSGWFPQYQALLDSTETDADIATQRLSLEAYCRYFCAETAMVVAPLKFLQKSANGDDQGVRFTSDTALEDHRMLVKQRKDAYKSKVSSFTTTYSPVVAAKNNTFLGLAVSSPSTDIITG